MHSLRLGHLGRWSGTLLDAGSRVGVREADRIWDIDWCWGGKYLATVSDTMLHVSVAVCTDRTSSLIAIQAGVERRDMAVVTSFRK